MRDACTPVLGFLLKREVSALDVFSGVIHCAATSRNEMAVKPLPMHLSSDIFPSGSPASSASMAAEEGTGRSGLTKGALTVPHVRTRSEPHSWPRHSRRRNLHRARISAAEAKRDRGCTVIDVGGSFTLDSKKPRSVGGAGKLVTSTFD